ncbi:MULTISPECIES: aspartate 1-decarboxylase [Psychrilyobacter]|uniref:Aspartate 1-decarboxylase n=1 Tax=Psychrilyobacter piezotolerans TaxID=2293438 RepID=A0ABX9KFQ0_9FUSO|nr:MULTISPECIES: aspartate 1-decarboxylase [Psychrilyobacter]MCS5423067.1 aspartate 1-decarboxylase [Psychrilyobacter sp. S5]NDI78497.1 aspartate 1-decarboxylase [Psychrilyobacter piezotolerans]RDE60492.1 aspartate 1-decarboxylase [Psychrilyobacter sp. S5]REI40522.1 aspartate 1-decarboxylase [Psychrilyobacter piezotolerans]
MKLQMLKGKIHRATVTQAELHYVGSITLDVELMEAAGIREYELVHIVDIDNGARFETYVIAGRERGIVCLNGAAARMVQTGDRVIIMAYCYMDESEAGEHKPKVVLLGENNKVETISSYEKHGRLV